MGDDGDPWTGQRTVFMNDARGPQRELVDVIMSRGALPLTVLRMRLQRPVLSPSLLIQFTPLRIYVRLGAGKILDDIPVAMLWRRYVSRAAKSPHALIGRYKRLENAPECLALLPELAAPLPPANFIYNRRMLQGENAVACWDMGNYEAARRVLEILLGTYTDEEEPPITAVMDPLRHTQEYTSDCSPDLYLWVQLPALGKPERKRSMIFEFRRPVPPPWPTGTTYLLAVDMAPIMPEETLQELGAPLAELFRKSLDERLSYTAMSSAYEKYEPALRMAQLLSVEKERNPKRKRDTLHKLAPPEVDAAVAVDTPLVYVPERSWGESRKLTLDQVDALALLAPGERNISMDEIATRFPPAKRPRQSFLKFTVAKQ